MSKWRLDKLSSKLPNRNYGKTNRDNIAARLIDINYVVDNMNEVLEDVFTTISNNGSSGSGGNTGGGNTGGGILLNTTAVSSSDGDDATGVVGDGNKPFATVNAATTAGATNVLILPGTYTEIVQLQSNTTYYCMAGVEFTSGGLTTTTDSNVSIENVRWLGYAVFLSAAYLKAECKSFKNIFIEFDYMDQTSGSVSNKFEPADANIKSDITIHANSVKVYAAQTGNGFNFYKDVDFNMVIAGDATASICLLRGTSSWTGNGYIKFRKAYILNGGGSGAHWYRGFIASQPGNTGHIEVVGDIVVDPAVTHTGTNGLIAGNAPGISVTHTGDIDAGGLPIVASYGGNSANHKFNGNIKGTHAFANLSGSGSLQVVDSTINCDLTSTINTRGDVLFYNTKITKGTNGTPLTFQEQPELHFYNCMIHEPGGSSDVITATGSVSAQLNVNMVNTVVSRDLPANINVLSTTPNAVVTETNLRAPQI